MIKLTCLQNGQVSLSFFVQTYEVNTVIKFFGGLLIQLKELTGNYIFAILLFSAVAAMLLFPFIKADTFNVLTCKALSEKISEISKKYAGNREQKFDNIAKLSAKYGVTALSFLVCSFFEVLVGFLITLGLKYTEISSADTVFLGVDLKMTIIQMFKSNGIVIPLVALMALAGIFEYTYDAVAQKDFIVDISFTNFISRSIAFAISLFLPCGFLIYWCGFELIELIVLLYVTKLRESFYIEKLKAQLSKKGKAL